MLEERVAELESHFSYRGRSGLAENHWDGETAVDSLSRAIRDLTLNASGYSYLGGTSNISLGHLLEPVLNSGELNAIDRELATGDDPNQDPLVTRMFPLLDADLPDISLLCDPIVETLYRAYIKHVSVQFPLIHTRNLRELHLRRNKPSSVYEICILHFVYAIGGRALEWVS